jgi:hypothetical protein
MRRIWSFSFEDSEGIWHEYPEECAFIGTDEEADAEMKKLANEWEMKTGDLCLTMRRDSQGIIGVN